MSAAFFSPRVDSPLILVHEYERQVTKLKAENWTLKMMLASKTDQVNKILTSKNIDLDVLQELNEREERIKELVQELRIAKDALEGSEVSAVAAASNLLENDAEATVEHSALQAKIENLENENDELKQELKDATGNVESLESENDALKKRIRELESGMIENLTHENDQLKEENKQLQNENADLLEKLEHANDLAYEANEERRKAMDDLDVLLNGIGEQDIDAALTTLETNKQVIEDLKAETEDLGRQNDELRMQMEALKEENGKLQKQVKDLTGKAKMLEARMERRSAQTSPVKQSPETEKRIRELEEKLEEANYDRHNLRRSLEAAEAQMELMSVGDLATHSKSAYFDGEVERLRDENETLKAQLEKLQGSPTKLVDKRKVEQELLGWKEECRKQEALIRSMVQTKLRNIEVKMGLLIRKVGLSAACLDRVTGKIPILIARKNVFPLANLRKSVVEFIGATKDMMQDLHDGANACIRAAAHKQFRKGIIPVPLTRQDRGCLIDLERKYDMGDFINPNSFRMDSDELKSTELSGMAFSPIARKGRFDLRKTRYQTTTELVRMKADIGFIGDKLQEVFSAFWSQAGGGGPCPNIVALIQTRNHAELARLFQVMQDFVSHKSIKPLSPKVTTLIQDIRNDVKTYIETLNEDHRLLVEAVFKCGNL